MQVVPDPGDLTETLRYNVTGLRPYSRYAIRVRAENKLGTSEPSQPSGKALQLKNMLKDAKTPTSFFALLFIEVHLVTARNEVGARLCFYMCL